MAQIETNFNRGDTVYSIGQPDTWRVLGSFVVDEIEATINVLGLEIAYWATVATIGTWHNTENRCFATEAEAQAECDKRNEENDDGN